MATRCLSRSILKKLSCSATTTAAASRSRTLPSFSHIRHRAISTAALFNLGNLLPTTAGLRRYSSLPATTSLRDNDPNFSNRPPKETILLDGCDFEHWLVVLEKPEGEPTREEIIDTYVKTLAQLLGSEEEARAKIYSVSTRCYFAFGCLIPEEMTYKMKELPQVRWVLPDSYLDVRNKDYGGEPFINGQAVPYDPKYHEEWIRNNARAGERNRRNDRPRNNDRSRNFERRRENMETRDVNRGPPNPAPMGGPPHNMGEPPQQMGGPGGPPTQQMGGPGGPPTQQMGGPGGPPRQMGGPGGPPQQMGGPGGPPRQMGGPGGPPQQMGGPGGPPQQLGRPGGPPRQMGGPPQQMGGPGGPPPNNAWSPPPPNNAWSPPPNNNMRGPPPPNNAWSPPPNNAWSPPPPNNAWAPPPNSMGGQQPPSMGGQQPPYIGGQQPPNMGGQQPPNNYQNNYGPPDGNVPYQR